MSRGTMRMQLYSTPVLSVLRWIPCAVLTACLRCLDDLQVSRSLLVLVYHVLEATGWR